MRNQMKIARLVRGLTQKQLGELVGCSELDVSRIETGRKNPAPALRARIAHALGKSENEVFASNEASDEESTAGSREPAGGPAEGEEVVPSV